MGRSTDPGDDEINGSGGWGDYRWGERSGRPELVLVHAIMHALVRAPSPAPVPAPAPEALDTPPHPLIWRAAAETLST